MRGDMRAVRMLWIDQKPPTRFSMDDAVSWVETLTKGEEDGWTYKAIEHEGYYWEIAAYDDDGTYLGSF
jgi:hypothetical protein